MHDGLRPDRPEAVDLNVFIKKLIFVKGLN